jgi:hypothetical protein
MSVPLLVTAILLAASPAPARPSPAAPRSPSLHPTSAPAASPSAEAATASAKGPVILFLVDNSASLPPLDPEEKRVDALEKVFGFLHGQPYRLILFGGRREIFVDDVSRYRNNGQWTDLYFAFDKAREVMQSYPAGTEFRLLLLTDAIHDPDPKDWADMEVPKGADLKTYSLQKLKDLVASLKVPLYVILVGNPPTEGVRPGDADQSPQLVLDLVQAANGRKASPTAQSLAAFFKDDGLLLKKFIFRVAPHEGLKRLEPVVRRIVAPSRPRVELQFLSALIVPLALFLCLLLGILVRSFPGPGDVEIIELGLNSPVHLAADRFHKVRAGGWGTTGLALVADAKEASATLTYQSTGLDLSGTGFDSSGLDKESLTLLPLSVEELKKTIHEINTSGTKEEKIYVLNLDYMAKNFDPVDAERLLTASPSERRKLPALDFLRAKAHLLTNDALRDKLFAPRVHFVSYGREAERKELATGDAVAIGRYRFVVGEVARGGRKDMRLYLFYDRVPSLLGLKSLLPAVFQKAFRLRGSSQRIVA